MAGTAALGLLAPPGAVAAPQTPAEAGLATTSAAGGVPRTSRVPAAPAAPKPKTEIRGWQATAAAVLPGRRFSDRVAVRTGGKRIARRIEVQRKARGTSQWSRVARFRTDDKGRANLTYSAAEEGSWLFRAFVQSDRTGRGARTAKRRVDAVIPEPVGVPLAELAVPPPPPPQTRGTTIAVTGDVGACGGSQDKTAAIIDHIDGPLIVPGDVAYPDGSAADFANCYDPFFGRFRDRTFPVPGNHEYRTPAAGGYFDYFGARVGDAVDPWYSVDIGAWRFYMLNSNCDEVGCSQGGKQYEWLAGELAKPQPMCTAAVWHHPRWTSGKSGSDPTTADLYQLMYSAGGELVLTGHQHHYERFAPLSPEGVLDGNGMRQFVVGTGGQTLRSFGPETPGSEVRMRDSHGVLRMELGPSGYQWMFLPAEPWGQVDTGWGLCH